MARSARLPAPPLPSKTDPPRISRSYSIDASNLSPRYVVARHQAIDDAVILAPRGLAVGVVAHDERGAGVELLVLEVAAGELRADQVPGELEELHPADGATLRGLEVGVELGRGSPVPAGAHVC